MPWYPQQSQAFDLDDLTKTVTVSINEWTHQGKFLPVTTDWTLTELILTIPNFTNAVTTTLAYQNAAAQTLWSVAGLAKNDTYGPYAIYKPFNLTGYFVLTLSGAAGGSGGTFTFDFFLRRELSHGV